MFIPFNIKKGTIEAICGNQEYDYDTDYITRSLKANINLEVYNLETDFFGDLHCSSRFTDMLCDAKAQYQDYSELEKCPVWGMWVKEGGEEVRKNTRRRVK